MMSVKLKKTPPCPACNEILSGATPMDGKARPKPNDLTVCIYCGVLLQFTEDLSLEQLPQAEVQALPPDVRQELLKAASVARQFRAHFPRPKK